jgi:hypothetical protein
MDRIEFFLEKLKVSFPICLAHRVPTARALNMEADRFDGR